MYLINNAYSISYIIYYIIVSSLPALRVLESATLTQGFPRVAIAFRSIPKSLDELTWFTNVSSSSGKGSNNYIITECTIII